MTFQLDDDVRLRFYGMLQLAVLAWSMLALALGGWLALPAIPLYTLALGGILVILQVAMRSRTYAHLKQSDHRD
ncbi:MAG TPA: hypothetical protein VG245_07195 [Candidatus Dormibacteraeota bacterium]|nr:hypothetical protein [Candidatus Dormibacteraeota bacterium]